jgi:hypothetical protein
MKCNKTYLEVTYSYLEFYVVKDPNRGKYVASSTEFTFKPVPLETRGSNKGLYWLGLSQGLGGWHSSTGEP